MWNSGHMSAEHMCLSSANSRMAVSSTSLITRMPSAMPGKSPWFVFDDIKVHRKGVCLAVAALASLHFPKRGAGKAVVAPASLQSQCGDLDGECRLRNDLCKDKAQGTDFSLFCRNILQMESKKLAGHAYFKYYACDEQSLKHHGEKHDKAFSLRGELGPQSEYEWYFSLCGFPTDEMSASYRRSAIYV